MPDNGFKNREFNALDNYKVIFGYKHVQDIPLCPCRDPGNYVIGEQSQENPMEVRFRCWCGRTMRGTMETQEELNKFLALADK